MSARLFYAHTTASLAARRDFDHDSYYNDDDDDNNKDSPRHKKHNSPKKQHNTNRKHGSSAVDNPNVVDAEHAAAFHKQQRRVSHSVKADDDRTASDLPSLWQKQHPSHPEHDHSHDNHQSQHAKQRKSYVAPRNASMRRSNTGGSTSAASRRATYSPASSTNSSLSSFSSPSKENNRRSSALSSSPKKTTIAIRAVKEERPAEEPAVKELQVQVDTKLAVSTSKTAPVSDYDDDNQWEDLRDEKKVADEDAVDLHANDEVQEPEKDEKKPAVEKVESKASEEKQPVKETSQNSALEEKQPAKEKSESKTAAVVAQPEAAPLPPAPSNESTDSAVDFEDKLKKALVAPKEEYMQTLFNEIDENKDGMLSMTEVEHAIFQRKAKFNLKPTVVLRAFQKADADEDGYIGQDEFYMFLCMITYFQNLHHVFELMDTNHDRRLSKQEFMTAASVLDVTEPEKVWEQMDTRHGGYIVFHDFCMWMAENKATV